MGKIILKPTLGNAEVQILGKKTDIPIVLRTEIQFKNPIEATAGFGIKKKMAIDRLAIIFDWSKEKKLILQLIDGGTVSGFTDKDLDKFHKQTTVTITESSIITGIDAYQGLLSRLLRY